MSEEKKEMTKKEKIEKAKELMQKVKDLELTEEELDGVTGGRRNYDNNDIPRMTIKETLIDHK